MISSFASGAQLTVLTTEHTLATVTNATPGMFMLTVDAAVLANGETLVLRAKGKTRSGDTSRLLYEEVYVNALGKPGIVFPELPAIEELIFTLTQTGGSVRTFPWNVLRLDPVQDTNLVTWIGVAPSALNNNKVQADVQRWMNAVPAALSANGYLQSMLLRWLTDNAAGTPNALSSGKVDSTLLVRGGTAQAGAASTITLDAAASAVDNLYRGLKCLIASGTGAGQCRLIASYVGATKVATITPAWTTAPDNTSVFIVAAHAGVDVELVALAQINALLSGRIDASLGSAQADTVDAVAIKADGATEIGNAARDALLAKVIDGLTVNQILGVMIASLAAKTNGFGAGPGTGNIRNLADTLNRLVTAFDASNNRTTVTLDTTGL